MATAEELLRGTVTQPNPEGHIVIGGNRFITVPSNLKRLGVQYDHNMETVTFDCPRYWDNRDMSEMAVYINYALSDGCMDRYPADNVRADDDIMHFDWTISRNVTQVAGAVSFLVCVMTADSDGNEERHWNSELCQDCYISPGMEAEESLVETQPDLVTQLLLRMDSVEKINVQADEMNAFLVDAIAQADRAEAARDIAVDSENNIKNSYANAIKQTVSGEVIRVDDVSPIEHNVKARVRGKNLVPLGYRTAHSTVVRTEDGGVQFTSDGVLTGYNEMRIVNIGDNTLYLEPGTYAFNLIGAPIGAHFIIGGGCASYTEAPSGTLTVEQAGYIDYIIVRFAKGYEYDCTVYPMLVKGEVIPTEYEPYIDPTTTTLTRCRKNIIPYPFTDTTVTRKGVTFTDNGDGSITLNGTAEATTSFVIFNGEMPVNGKYTMSGLTGGSGSTYYIQPVCSDKAYRGLTDGPYTYDWSNITLNRIQLSVVVGTKFSNLKVKPMLEFGESASSFEQYEGTTVTPASDGTCTVKSKSPTMTLFTDTAGAIIEAEYNADTMTYLDSCFRPTDEQVRAAVDAWLNSSGIGSIPTLTNIALPASAWVGENSPYSQVVNIAGVTKYSKVDLLPSVEQLAIFHDKDVAFVTENEDGVVTVYAIGDKPVLDYTMQAQITEVVV